MLFNIVAFNGAALMNKLASQSSRAAIIGQLLLPLKDSPPSPFKHLLLSMTLIFFVTDAFIK